LVESRLFGSEPTTDAAVVTKEQYQASRFGLIAQDSWMSAELVISRRVGALIDPVGRFVRAADCVSRRPITDRNAVQWMN
jgi:hypothetical protein